MALSAYYKMTHLIMSNKYKRDRSLSWKNLRAYKVFRKNTKSNKRRMDAAMCPQIFCKFLPRYQIIQKNTMNSH